MRSQAEIWMRRSADELSFDERLQFLQNKRKDIFFRQVTDKALFQRSLGFNDAPAPATARMPYDLGLSPTGVEGQLNVVVARTIGHQPHAARWREHREHVAFSAENG